MYNAIKTTGLFLTAFFSSHTEFKIFTKSFLERILPTKVYNRMGRYSKIFFANQSQTTDTKNSSVIQKISNTIKKIRFKPNKPKLLHITDTPPDLLDIIFSYVLENNLDENDLKNYVHMFYVDKLFFQKNVVLLYMPKNFFLVYMKF